MPGNLSEVLMKESMNVTAICFNKANNSTQFLEGVVKSCSISSYYLTFPSMYHPKQVYGMFLILKKKKTLNKIGLYFSCVKEIQWRQAAQD